MRIHLAMLALLTLTSCASLRKVEVAYLPPRIDCAAFDAPKAKMPETPSPRAALPEWQLHAWGWQAYAEGVLMQRVETARCLADLRAKGIVK